MQKRQRARVSKLAQRHERAWEVAHRASRLLREAYGASRVMVFGSLVHGYWFSLTSDIDMAAWGISKEDFFIAVAKLQDLSLDFSFDLVRMEDSITGLQEAVLQHGKEI